MPRNRSKNSIDTKEVVMNEQQYASYVHRSIQDDITPPILKNAVILDGDGKLQTPRKERQVSEKAMPKND